MEGNKESAGSSSSSSFVDDLFRPKENPDTQIIFDAIFRPAYKVRGESLEFQKNGSESAAGVVVQGEKDKGAVENVHKQFQFHYSSSIYYGGPDLYNINPPQEPSPPFFTTLNKDGGEDEPGYASRGNWWMGSLYY